MESGGHMQLLMDMDVAYPRGDLVAMKILVDTGAQVNLVRSNLVPPEFLKMAKDPVRLLAANNSVLFGGDKTVEIELHFQEEREGILSSNPLCFRAEFYVAEIDVDMILSYPWLRQNQVGVFPHHDALAIDTPYFALLHGWKSGCRAPEKGVGKRNERKIRTLETQTNKKKNQAQGACSFGREPARWWTREYSVRAMVVQEILSRFGVRPNRDGFANSKNKRFRKWWGPGSSCGEDAFEHHWGSEVLWMNPPYDVLDKVLEKIVLDQAHVILVILVWKKRKFFAKAESMCLGKVVYPQGYKFFERPQGGLKGLRWPVQAMLVCGHTPLCAKQEFCVKEV